MRDPYDVLGVTKTATEAEIKSAYRKLAKKHHPDQNKTDPKAKERFAEANAAYEIVGDKAKRKQYDRGEIGADGKPRFQGFEGFGQDPRAGGAGGFNPGGGARTFRWSTGGGGEDAFGEDILSDILGGFGRTNLVQFHALDGSAYRFYADMVMDIDTRNPSLASRLVSLFNQWKRFDPKRQALMKAELERIVAKPGLSAGVFEIATKALN